MMNSAVAPSASGRTGLTVVVLGFGPVLTVAALANAAGGSWLDARLLPAALIVALLAWSPLPVSIPAVILGDARDSALPRLRGAGTLLRAVALVPWLLFSRGSRVRPEMAASLAGFAAAAVAVLAICR